MEEQLPSYMFCYKSCFFKLVSIFSLPVLDTTHHASYTLLSCVDAVFDDLITFCGWELEL